FLPAQCDVVAERERAALDEAAIRGERGEVDAHLVDPGQSLDEAFGDRVFDRALEPLQRRKWNDRADQLLRGIDEQPCRLAVAVFHHAPAGGIARMAVNARR